MYETTGEKNFKWLHAARQVQSKSVSAPRFQIGLKIRYLQIFFQAKLFAGAAKLKVLTNTPFYVGAKAQPHKKMMSSYFSLGSRGFRRIRLCRCSFALNLHKWFADCYFHQYESIVRRFNDWIWIFGWTYPLLAPDHCSLLKNKRHNRLNLGA